MLIAQSQGHKLGSKVKNRNILPCPGYNLSMHGWILKLFGPKLRSKVTKGTILVFPGFNLIIPGWILKLLGSNVFLGKTLCQD